MKKEFLEKIENILITEREGILSRNHDAEIDSDGDEADEIQANLISSINNHISSMDKMKLVQINNALIKIKNGLFGTCEECEDEISEKRLLANPKFITCISCAEELEMQRSQKK